MAFTMTYTFWSVFASFDHRRMPFDVVGAVRRSVERSCCTAGRVELQHDQKLISSFTDVRGVGPGTRSRTVGLWPPFDGARVLIIGATSDLGQALARACCTNPLVGSVTAAVRDTAKAESTIRPYFTSQGRKEAMKKKGYVLTMNNVPEHYDDGRRLHVVQVDVKDDTSQALQQAIASSDIVFYCASGSKDAANVPSLVDRDGALRAASWAARSDATFVYFSGYYSRSMFRWYYLWNAHRVKPYIHRCRIEVERAFLTDDGLHSQAFSPRAEFIAGMKCFPDTFRFSVFRLTDILPLRMSSGFEFALNNDLRHHMRDAPWPLSPHMAAMVALRAVLCHRSTQQTRIDIAGRDASVGEIPSQIHVDAIMLDM